MRLHCDVVWWLITMKWSWWLHNVLSKYPVIITRWLHCPLFPFVHHQMSNSHGDFPVESPNGDHLRIILETNDIYHILIHHSDCDTCNHLWRSWDVTLTGCAVTIAPICYIWRSDSFLSSTHNSILFSKINIMLDFSTPFVFTSLNKIVAISSNLCFKKRTLRPQHLVQHYIQCVLYVYVTEEEKNFVRYNSSLL